MTTHHVVTTLNKPTTVTCAVKGNFVHANEENLILCKGSCIEIYNILLDGVALFKEINLYGVISKMELFTIPFHETCSLFLLTDQNYYTVLSYNPTIQTVVTEGHGLLQVTNARISDQPISAIVDMHSRTILVSAFTGILFSIPFHKSDNKGKSKQIRFEPVAICTNEFDFISMVSLKNVKQPTLAVLLGEMNELKTIKCFKYDPRTNEIVENEKLAVKVEATAHTLIAVPDPIGGVLAIGEYIISYHPMTSASNTPKEVSIDPVLVTAYTFFNGSFDKCVLGDSDGVLYLLTLEISGTIVTNMTSTVIGNVSYPSSIVDLGNDMLYIGSAQGDPCIVRLLYNPKNGKYTSETITSFSNLGPIVDFCLFDYDQQGKKTMVCCSGVDKDGSLRIVENGIGFLEKYTLQIPLISNVWSLSSYQFTSDIVVVSTCYQTVVLKQISDTQVQELTEYSAFIMHEPTLAMVSSESKGYIIQVTPSCIRLMTYGDGGEYIGEWKPPQGELISMAKLTTAQCVICCGKGTLVYLECTRAGLVEKGIAKLPDISCISLSGEVHTTLGTSYVLASTWTSPAVYLLRLPNLTVAYEKVLNTICPRDLLLVELENKCYLMVLLGNGQLLSYVLEKARTVTEKIMVSKEKQTMVGTYCTGIFPYKHQGRRKLFITGSRPTVIASFNQNLYFSTVNIKDVFGFAQHNNDIILMTHDGLLFGQIDANQKLHHTKIKLETGMPNRIQYLGISKSLAVGTVLTEKDSNNGFNLRKGKVQLLDAQTFRSLDIYDFPGNDLVESMTVATFREYPNQEYLFVGTVVEDKEDPDASTGHIFIFEIKESSRLELLEKVEKPGVIYDMRAFQNSVVACVNGSIYCMNKFRPDLPAGERVSFELNVHKNVLALSLDTRNDKVLVGDLMRSLSVLCMTSDDPLKVGLEATDTKPAWTTAVKFVNDNVFMGADDRNNIFTLEMGEPARLILTGGYHIGSFINCFRDDTLMDVSSSGTREKSPLAQPVEKSFSFATVHGSIGTIKTISSEAFEFFIEIQEGVLALTTNIGKLDYHSWRNYKPKLSSSVENGTEVEPNPMFLDGDILKQYLYMSPENKTRIVRDNSILSRYQVTDIENLINDLVSLHK